MTREDDNRDRALLGNRLSSFAALAGRRPSVTAARPQRQGAPGGAAAPASAAAAPASGSTPAGTAGHTTGQSTRVAWPRATGAGPKTTEIVGGVHGLRQYGDWAIAYIIDDDLTQHRITGSVVAQLKEGDEYRVTGYRKNHPTHGDSLELTSFEPHIPVNEEALVRFISANFKGIGEKSARKFVDATHAADPDGGLQALRDQLLRQPWSVDFSVIKREGEFAAGSEDRSKTILAYIQRNLALRLTKVPAKVVTALAGYLAMRVDAAEAAATRDKTDQVDPVETAWAILSKDPYTPIKNVPGYGFAIADMVGRQLLIPRDAPERLAALVAHALDERCDALGHAFLALGSVKAAICETDSAVNAAHALRVAIEAKSISLESSPGPCGTEQRAYPARLLDAERKLARRIAEFCREGEPLTRESGERLRKKIDTAARSLGAVFKNGLDPSQSKAIERILTTKTRLHTITAEPGSGKTAVMEVLTAVLPNSRFVFCAPTGKGAKVLSNRVRSRGYSASTIHSLLGGDPESGFQHDAESPLSGDVLVIDEGSMPDLRLAAAIFEAAHDDMHVIVLGDVDQLPSIAPGRFLADLLEIDAIDHHRLTTVHRNSGGILDVVREVRSGTIVPRDRDSVSFSNGLPTAATGFRDVMSEYIAAVGRSGYAGTALLMSRRKGDVDMPGWNTTYANAVLREICNPGAQKIPGSSLTVGDRIIIKANMAIGDDEPKVRVVNGDTGQIKSFEASTDKRKAGAKSIRLALDDGREVDFPGDCAASLHLGYALTVHAAQGSEYKDVIAVITPGQPTFINRNMLYTGLSRARTRLSVHAEDADLLRISGTPMPRRNSGLVQRVRALCSDGARDDEGAQRWAEETGPGDLGPLELPAGGVSGDDGRAHTRYQREV